jgi:His/Glu/Gln/Arg/opine family amino acid ABC transporter permease subunit
MIGSGFLVDLLQGGLVSLEIAVGAWIVASVLGLVLAVARDLGLIVLKIPIIGLSTTLRSLPQLVILYLFYFGVGQLGIEVNSLLAAILALGVTDAAFVAEYYRAGFMTVSPSQRDAGRSIGLSELGVMRSVVIPQAVPYVVPPLLNAFVGLMKTATLASAVGTPEILYRAQSDISRTGQIVQTMAVLIILYLLATMPLTRAVAVLERRARSMAYA